MKYLGVIIVVVAVTCSLGCKRGEDHYIQEMVDLTGQPPEVAYVELNCAKCHGAGREGQRTAPTLTGLSKRWDAEGLIAYLRDPKAVQAATPRLAYLAEKYPIEMPAYAHTDEQVLQSLTGWLLAE
jgi:hypothetical protein